MMGSCLRFNLCTTFDTFLWLLAIIMTLDTVISSSTCSSNTRILTPKYHRMEKCYRSKLGIAAKANFSSLTSCQRLGIERNGLALNFSPREAWQKGSEPLNYTCEILKCAETDGAPSLVNDTRYDYYSTYAKPLPHVNSTCIPGLGMFFLSQKKLNYTLAVRECKNMTGTPAYVTNEQRTDAFAQLLAGTSTEAAFVGLRSKNGSSFISSNGDSLDCNTYRAWAPGHPRRQRDRFDCVLITRQRTWQSTSCNRSYPMLCELLPGGPYKKGSIFFSRNQRNNDTTDINDDE